MSLDIPLRCITIRFIIEITIILDRVEQGDPRAAEELLPLVYEELRRLATAKMAHQAQGQTLQATALVHEAYLRLIGGVRDRWQDRAHFFRAAAEAMRCILIDNARKKSCWKRGVRLERVELEGVQMAADTPPDTLLVVHEALERFTAEDPTKAELVRLRFFIGLNQAESAQALGLSEPTVKRYWEFSRAWLLREIRVIAAGG
jgi:RNA polymerase sigma factor (TIGR02999 family)